MLTEKMMVSRVRKGIKLLNSVKPNWHEIVKLKRLDLYDDGHCILGQLYGLFWDGASTIFGEAETYCDPTSTGDDPALDLSAPYGFAIECKVQDKFDKRKDKSSEKAHKLLTSVWKSEIRKFQAVRKLVKEYYE